MPINELLILIIAIGKENIILLTMILISLFINSILELINKIIYKKSITEEKTVVSVAKDEKEDTTEEPIFICPKSDLYGIYLKAGQKLYLK